MDFPYEEWRSAPGLPDYEVSSFGRFRHVDRKMIRRPLISEDGYRYASVADGNGGSKRFKIARLVCIAFNGVSPDDLPEVDHIDRDRTMDHKDNLKWTDRVGNLKNQRRAIGAENGHAKLTEKQVVEIRSCKTSATTLAKKYGVHPKTVRDARKGVTWSYLK